jgi:predicted NodU family carbamoyl transferase
MKILSYNPGHDGAIAYIDDSRLIFSIESEKDSNYRYSGVSVTDVLDAVSLLGEIPDVICMSGWWPLHHHEFLHGSHRNSGYRGLLCTDSIIHKGGMLRGKADYFSSSHERSHILCAFGMSGLPQGTPCYALVWEGEMGTFYEVDSASRITLIADVLTQPGNRYSLGRPYLSKGRALSTQF